MLSDLQRRRALDAERVLDDPLLNECFKKLEQAAIDELLGVRGWMPWADAKRRVLSDRVHAIRAVRNDLATMIADAKAAAQRPVRFG